MLSELCPCLCSHTGQLPGSSKGHHCRARASSPRVLVAGPAPAPGVPPPPDLCTQQRPSGHPLPPAHTPGHCHLSHGTGKHIPSTYSKSDVMFEPLKLIPHTTFIITTLHCPLAPLACVAGLGCRKCRGRGGEQSGAASRGILPVGRGWRLGHAYIFPDHHRHHCRIIDIYFDLMFDSIFH